MIDRALAKRKLARRVALRVPSFLAAAVVVAESDLVLTLPRRLAEQVRRLAPLELHAPPMPLEPFHFHLAWHVAPRRARPPLAAQPAGRGGFGAFERCEA